MLTLLQSRPILLQCLCSGPRVPRASHLPLVSSHQLVFSPLCRKCLKRLEDTDCLCKYNVNELPASNDAYLGLGEHL